MRKPRARTSSSRVTLARPRSRSTASSTEAQWAQAEKITLKYDQTGGIPGSGQKIESGTLISPTDPLNATLSVLRKGNLIYFGLQAADKSIGGGRGLQANNWFFDGIIMNIGRRIAFDAASSGRGSQANTEFIYGWWHPADTTATGGQRVNAKPRAFGNYACDFPEDPANGICTIRRDTTVWNYRTTWTGITNDDATDDGGYVMEMMVDASKMSAATGVAGYDFTKAGGDRMPFNFAVEDSDYRWPVQATKEFTSRVWFQNQWANNFIHGQAFIVGAPGVTTTSGALSSTVTNVDFRIPNGTVATAPVLDGQLNDRVWQNIAPIFTIKYQDQAILSQNPGGIDFARYFSPNITGTATAGAVVDPSTARIKMFYRGDVLYVGMDVDDQAISGAFQSEDRRDGLRLNFFSREADATTKSLKRLQFDFVVDSTGNVRYSNDALGIRAATPDAITAVVRLKSGSTVANPNDVDNGYSMEIAINLPLALKYPAGRGDGYLFVAPNFFDADILPDAASSSSTRTWLYRERADGPTAVGYMDPSITTVADVAGAADGLVSVYGVMPNPSANAATLALPPRRERAGVARGV